MSKHLSAALLLEILEDQSLGGMLQSQGHNFLRSFGMVRKRGDLRRILEGVAKQLQRTRRIKATFIRETNPTKFQKGAYAISCRYCYQGVGRPCMGIGNPKGNSSFWGKILMSPHRDRVEQAKQARRGF